MINLKSRSATTNAKMNLSGGALIATKDLLKPISIAGVLDNQLVEVEYKGRQSNVILTTQGESLPRYLKNENIKQQ
jgi:hypothetical protein